jgi:ferredoxin--NADP+ reductase
MFEILKKTGLANQIYLMEIKAPRIANSANPGQFLIVKMDEKGERIPLTICDYDKEKGTVTVVFQTVGNSTNEMANYEEGEFFSDVVGPLGTHSEFVNEEAEALKKKKIIFIAGGVGTAPVYPQVKWLFEHGVKADVIIGAKTKELVILEDKMKAVAGEVYVVTDDGSYGYKGLVTNLLKELVEKQGKKYDEVIAIGPMIMMKFVSKLTEELNLKTIVSLNTLMVDGTGMCGACRVTVGGKIKFACVDGPEFDGHLVNFDEAMRRQTMYKSEEAKTEFKKEHANAGGHKCGCASV